MNNEHRIERILAMLILDRRFLETGSKACFPASTIQYVKLSFTYIATKEDQMVTDKQAMNYIVSVHGLLGVIRIKSVVEQLLVQIEIVQ